MPRKDTEETRAYLHVYYLKNKERMLEQQKKYRLNNREKARKRWCKYRETNKERITEWRKTNIALLLQHNANRRARKKRAIPAWLKNCEIEKRRVYTVYLLSRLLAKADGIQRHVDHMVPLSDGGPHWSGNLQVLTKEQNLEKGTYSCPKLKKQIKLNLKEARALHVKAA
tara:strand:- start:35 stop:544 length:510 start_codon:yes stop_codon:yes gene_type:complete